MKRVLSAAALSLALAAAWIAGAGCASSLSGDDPGHTQCGPAGECLAGFTCDKTTNTCLLDGTLPDASTSSSTGTGGSGGSGGHGGRGGHGGAGSTTSTSSTGGTGGCADGGAGCPVTCDAGETQCGDACVDTTTDAQHCGSCNDACDPPVSGTMTGAPRCKASACDATCNTTTPLMCAVEGGVACVDPQIDPQYCGDCDTHCPGGKTCVNGACVSACPQGLTMCNGKCVNLQSDPNHCGACNNAACNGVSPFCKAGKCELVALGCGAGLTACSVGGLSACVNLQKDPTHCGACGKACGQGEVCGAGTCKPYIFASACWECGNGNDLNQCCDLAGKLICTSGPCPQ